jgi:hypothetical protein
MEMTMRVLALSLAAATLAGGLALAQTAPQPNGNVVGPATPQEAFPGQGNGSGPGGSNPGGIGPAAAPPGNGRGVDSEFSRFRLDAQGRAPLTAPPGSLDPGRAAPSQPPQTIPPHPWMPPRRG